MKKSILFTSIICLLSLVSFSQKLDSLIIVESKLHQKKLKNLLKSDSISENNISSCTLVYGALTCEIIGVKLHSDQFDGYYNVYFKNRIIHNARKEKLNNHNCCHLIHRKIKNRTISKIEKHYWISKLY